MLGRREDLSYVEYEATLETRARKARRRWAQLSMKPVPPRGTATGAGQAQTVLIGQHESSSDSVLLMSSSGFSFGLVVGICGSPIWSAWCLEARLAQPANSMPVVKFSFFFCS